MVKRPLFVSCVDGPVYVQAIPITFQWHAGMAESQRKKSLAEFHRAVHAARPDLRVLEVSRFAQSHFGVALSAFNLSFVTKGRAREISVECAFQASKVFTGGGPFIDLLDASSLDAKRDPRLKNSGNLISFHFFGRDWSIEPQTAFYDWLYLNALKNRPALADAVLEYDAFTDIAFNPEKSINCQAGAVALFVALSRRGLLNSALAGPEAYLATLRAAVVSNARQDDLKQGSLRFE